MVLGACGGEEGATDGSPDRESTAATAEADDDAAPPSIIGRAPPASGGLPAVIVLHPVDGGVGTEPDTSTVESGVFPESVIDQFGLAFVPRTLVVPAGTTVTFTNSEGSLVHNVHVRSLAGDSTVFNGDAAPGDEVAVPLPEPGGYDVLCDMHPGMTAFVYATDAPWAATAAVDGRFEMGDVPPGRYTLRAWTDDDGLGDAREIVVEEGVTTEVDLTTPS